MVAYDDLVMTSRTAGLSDRPRPTIYVLHRADCTRKGANAVPLTAHAVGPEVILRKVRHGLNARACRYCNPDPAPRTT